MRYLGIDYGTGKVGLALSDEAGTMGFPKDVFENDGRLGSRVRELAAAEGVGAIVIGDSMDMSGKPNPVAAEAKAFGARLSEESGLPVYYEIEMLTTQEARRSLDGTHPNAVTDSARKRTKGAAAYGTGAVDASAAALILTSYLSRSHD